MTIYHNTRDEKYRSPFGAQVVGSRVRLAIEIFDEMPTDVSVRVWVDGQGESMYPMYMTLQGSYCRYEIELELKTCDIYWYCFKIVGSTGETVWYGAKENQTGGLGKVYENEAPSFQITSYAERKAPDWYKKGIAYQIFPDRFNRGRDYQQRLISSLTKRRRGPLRLPAENWYDDPYYEREESGAIKEWRFYGGTLTGIIEKLDYLEELGVTIIYLNPIFEAASNHRYDTGDYFKIDPILGDEAGFEALCKAAEKRGIHIILDGVFNHTGADSIYFNRYDNYDSVGAYNHYESPYRSWFHFDNSQVGYSGWWGVADLPDVDENNPKFRELIYEGDESVVRKWLRSGAKGWRLDVADELPDDFIVGIKKAMVEELGDEALLMGEVWEDATNKIAYSKLRRYLLGEELDCVMNYPFREAITSFVKGQIRAEELSEVCMRLLENYPPEAFLSNFNLLGSHDRIRVLTLLSEAPAEELLDEVGRRYFKLNDEQLERAITRLRLALIIQMTLPGVPVIYYGDEAGMQGYTDPFNRGPYPWGRENRKIMKLYQEMISLRTSNPIFTEGDFLPMYFNQDVFGIRRRHNGETIYVLVNKNPYLNYEVKVHVSDAYPVEILYGRKVTAKNGVASVTVNPLDASVVFCSNDISFRKNMEDGCGVFCHITSLPNGTLPGTIGEEAHRFVSFLKENKQKYWQMLSIHPTDDMGSPVDITSAFAGNIHLLGKSREELQRIYTLDRQDAAFLAYMENEKSWLREYSMFAALQEKFEYTPWQQWPQKYRHYSESLWEDSQLEAWATYFSYEQFYFDYNWNLLHEEAKRQGIHLIGSVPMYVTADSCDVWAHPELFMIDENDRMLEEACIAPGKEYRRRIVLGCPTYRWNAHKKQNYDWWVRRIEHEIKRFDYILLNRFSDFDSYFYIQHEGGKNEERWKRGPGFELFYQGYQRTGNVPIILEDKADMTPSARELRLRTGFPGVELMESYEGSLSHYEGNPGMISYTGMQDSMPFHQWVSDNFPGRPDMEEELLLRLYRSKSSVVIIPLQDAIGLGAEGRMNNPGTVGNNWKWKAEDEQMEAAGKRLRHLAEESGRDK